jgi:hypothetical protein
MLKLIKNLIDFDKSKNFAFPSKRFEYLHKFDITSA